MTTENFIKYAPVKFSLAKPEELCQRYPEGCEKTLLIHFSFYKGVKTLSADARKDHVRTYGIWASLIGLALGGAITYFMFVVADGFA